MIAAHHDIHSRMPRNSPALYERMKAGRHPKPDGWDPPDLDPRLNADMSAMAVAEELGGWVSALDVPRIPLHYVSAARTRILVRQKVNAPKDRHSTPEGTE